MRRVSWQLGGLSWRLTLSYVLVTLVAAFTILFVVTLASTIQDLQQVSASPDQVLAKAATMHPEMYLEEPLPNDEALRYWVAIPLFDSLSKGQIRISFVAVLDRKGQVVSATTCGTTQLLAQGILPFFLASVWNHLPMEGLFFILLAIVLGTLTGLLISRNLTRRLRQIILAANTRSKGEFQVMLKDTSSDEVGQLARNLNGMAEQLHLLQASWQELAVVKERNRLARELHDSVKQHAFTTALLVRAARKVLSHDPQKA